MLCSLDRFAARLASRLKPLSQNIRGDILGGLTTGVVALPLALALGVASGAGAAAGLYSAIFTGIIAGLFGGTPAQISGPTAGMTAVLINVYDQLGIDGLFAAMFIGGAFQVAFAAARVGKYIHLLPRPVVAGFTNGIAILIFWKQFADIFLPGGRMFSLPEQLLAAGVVLVALVWPRLVKAVPGSLVAVALATAAAIIWKLPVALLGALPSGLPRPSLAFLSLDLAALPTVAAAGLVIALLGAIESLLASTVVDEMIGTRHHSDREIFGQGLANLVAPIFGGLAGTGAIVRSAVNVRAGGRTPLAGVVHSLLIASVTLGLGRYAALIPLPALWGILIATAFKMIEWESVRDLLRAPKSDSAVMVVTTALTVIEDLTVGVAAGLLLSFVLFALRMTRLPITREHRGDHVVIACQGPLFFGVAKRFLDEVEACPHGCRQVWDLSRASVVDATGAAVLRKAREECERRGCAVEVVGLQPQAGAVLARLGVLTDAE